MKKDKQMNITLRKAGFADKAIFQRLMQLYLYDFTEFLPIELDENGLFPETILDSYFDYSANPSRDAFLITADDRIAGFVLVSSHILLQENEGGKCIKEFFVLKNYRRRGVGTRAATAASSLYLGRWEVRVVKTNPKAGKFWESVINSYTAGNYKKEYRDDEVWRGAIFSLRSEIP
ncbi:MAG TPA: GNAT family N-acetyltransferase [Blastocatellia bacterium]|nr:GNAT family N-acetyltransferase [Blastocatellia bacterium]